MDDKRTRFQILIKHFALRMLFPARFSSADAVQIFCPDNEKRQGVYGEPPREQRGENGRRINSPLRQKQR